MAVAASTVGFEISVDTLGHACFAVYTPPRFSTFARARLSVMQPFVEAFTCMCLCVLALVTEDAIPTRVTFAFTLLFIKFTVFTSGFTRIVADFLGLLTLTSFCINCFAIRAFALASITARPSPAVVFAFTLALFGNKLAIYTFGILAGGTLDTTEGSES